MILGPLLYILFTNDVPHLVHRHPSDYKEPEAVCDDCGGVVCCVDDATYSVGHRDPAVLSNVLSTQYQIISSYMMANKLVINDDKTNLMVVGTKGNRVLRGQVEMQAGRFSIQPVKTAKLL